MEEGRHQHSRVDVNLNVNVNLPEAVIHLLSGGMKALKRIEERLEQLTGQTKDNVSEIHRARTTVEGTDKPVV